MSLIHSAAGCSLLVPVTQTVSIVPPPLHNLCLLLCILCISYFSDMCRYSSGEIHSISLMSTDDSTMLKRLPLCQA